MVVYHEQDQQLVMGFHPQTKRMLCPYVSHLKHHMNLIEDPCKIVFLEKLLLSVWPVFLRQHQPPFNNGSPLQLVWPNFLGPIFVQY